MTGERSPDVGVAVVRPPGDLKTRFRTVAELSKREVSPAEFFSTVLSLLDVDLAAEWAAVWTLQAGNWQPFVWRAAAGDSARSRIVAEGYAVVAEAAVGDFASCQRTTLTDSLVLITLPIPGEQTAVIQTAVSSLPVRRGDAVSRPAVAPEVAEELLEAYGQLCEDFGRNRGWRQARRESLRQQRLAQAGAAIHRSLDRTQTAYSIVAETAALTGCTRVCLITSRRGSFRVAAISGIATVDPRSAPVRTLNRLATAVKLSGEPLIHGIEPVTLPEQLAEPLDAYLDWSHAQGLIAWPLRSPTGDGVKDVATSRQASPDGSEAGGASSSCPGVIVIETDDPRQLSRLLDDVRELAPRFATALSNAERYSDLPLRRVGERLRAIRDASPWRTGTRLSVVVATVTAMIAALLLIPAPLKIESPGTLEPAEVHNAFAPRDGYVSEIWVEQDQPVAAGEPLLRIESPDLELELRRIEGAIESTQKELRAAESARRRGGTTVAEADRPGGFAASEAKLRAVLESHQRQQELLRQEQLALTLHSPLDGQVLTWRLRQTLLGRPVQRGQRLVRVAAQESRWTLSLELPDRDIGHVLAARDRIGPELAVSYRIATDPQRLLTGRLSAISAVTDMSDRGEPIVDVTVAIDRDDLLTPRAGAQVRAEIDCGPHALGYVWFHRFWDLIRSWITF